MIQSWSAERTKTRGRTARAERTLPQTSSGLARTRSTQMPRAGATSAGRSMKRKVRPAAAFEPVIVLTHIDRTSSRIESPSAEVLSAAYRRGKPGATKARYHGDSSSGAGPMQARYVATARNTLYRVHAVGKVGGGPVTRPGRLSRTTGLLRGWGGIGPSDPWARCRRGVPSPPTGLPRARRRARDSARQHRPPAGSRPLGSRLARDLPRAPRRGQGCPTRGDLVIDGTGVRAGHRGDGPVVVGSLVVGRRVVGRPMTGHRALRVRRRGGRSFRG